VGVRWTGGREVEELLLLAVGGWAVVGLGWAGVDIWWVSEEVVGLPCITARVDGLGLRRRFSFWRMG
jgi:hypothetical protein